MTRFNALATILRMDSVMPAQGPQRWTLANGRFQVLGHANGESRLVERFATLNEALSFARRAVNAGRFEQCTVRDSMAGKGEQAIWNVQATGQAAT